MDSSLAIAVAGMALYAVGSASYVRGILKGSVVPHPFSFATWTILVAINVGILYRTDAGWGTVAAAAQMVVLFFYTVAGGFKFRKISIDWFDYACLFSAVVLLSAWWFIGDLLSAVFTVAIEFVAFLPSCKKVLRDPFSENVFPWAVATVYPVFLLLAASTLTLSNTLYWAYLILANGAFTALVYFKQRSAGTAKKAV